jgi:hypothetical protein
VALTATVKPSIEVTKKDFTEDEAAMEIQRFWRPILNFTLGPRQG